VERLVGACGVAGGVEVLEQAADDGEHDSGQFGSAETAHAFFERCEPVRRRGPPEAGPEWFSCRIVQPVEHAVVGLALRSGDPGPGAGGRVGLVGSQADEVGEDLDLALAGLSEHLAEQSVTSPEVVDQHSVGRARGARQRPEPVRQPVLRSQSCAGGRSG
jgi:hypothetical protein